MTNAALKAILDEEGAKVRYIKTTSHSFMLNQYWHGEETIKNSDIEYLTKGNVEIIKVKRWEPSSKKFYHEYYSTETIEKIIVVDNESDVLDPYLTQL